jgi:hypothetical protein
VFVSDRNLKAGADDLVWVVFRIHLVGIIARNSLF